VLCYTNNLSSISESFSLDYPFDSIFIDIRRLAIANNTPKIFKGIELIESLSLFIMIPKNPEHQPINKFVEPQIIRPFPKPIL
jgi:hypothetical protein